MNAARVAVQVGSATVRVATADGGPRLVAERPGEAVRGPEDLPDLLAAVVGPAPMDLLVVHPSWWPAERVAAWPGCPVAAAVAAAAGSRRVVLRVGRSGAEAALVDRDRTVVHRRCATGGARLDGAVARLLRCGPEEARRVREALSLLPAAGGIDAAALHAVLAPLLAEVVELVRAVHCVGPAPVLLVGGVARSPLLAELLDEADVPGVVVAERPEAAAVLGALVSGALVSGAMALPVAERSAGGASRSNPWTGASPTDREGVAARRPPANRAAPGAGPDVVAAGVAAGVAAVVPAAVAAVDGAGPATPGWLPAPSPRRRPARAAVGAFLAAVMAAALLGVGTLLPPPRPAGREVTVPAGVLVQYGYRFDVPAGWEHSGGLPERRRSLLTPAATPEGSDLIAVERTPLGYDVAAEPDRARRELRATFDAAVATGSALSGYGPAQVVGRTVTAYRQVDGAAVVDWFVVLDGDAQLSVGCRHTPSGERAVGAACAVVVGSVRRA